MGPRRWRSVVASATPLLVVGWMGYQVGVPTSAEGGAAGRRRGEAKPADAKHSARPTKRSDSGKPLSEKRSAGEGGGR